MLFIHFAVHYCSHIRIKNYVKKLNIIINYEIIRRLGKYFRKTLSTIYTLLLVVEFLKFCKFDEDVDGDTEADFGLLSPDAFTEMLSLKAITGLPPRFIDLDLSIDFRSFEIDRRSANDFLASGSGGVVAAALLYFS
jgi:hypothetical protein